MQASCGVRLFSKARFFLVPLFTILCLCLIYDSRHSEVAIFLRINSWNSWPADDLFRCFTFIGNGLTYVVLIIVFYFINKFYCYLLASCFLLTAVATQLLKRLLFFNMRRPAGIIQNASHFIHHVGGISLYTQHSFPSGHTATCFSMFLLLTLYFNKKPFYGLFFLLLACLTAYSRIYLGEHFLIDVIGGAGLGVFMTIFTTVAYVYMLSEVKKTGKSLVPLPNIII